MKVNSKAKGMKMNPKKSVMWDRAKGGRVEGERILHDA